MKKIIVGVVLILVVAGIGTPFVTGLIMEKMIKQSYGDINKIYTDTGSGISIEILQYDRGFSASTIQWKVRIRGMEPVDGVEGITFVDQVKHGYTSVVSTTILTENKWYSDFVDEQLGGKDPLQITTEYKLSRAIESTIVVERFSVEVEGNVLDVGAGKLVTDCRDSLKRFESKGTWEGISSPDVFKVEGVSMEYNLEMISTYIWDGVFSLALKSAQFPLQGDYAEIVNFSSDYVLDYDPNVDQLSISSGIGADSIEAGTDKVENAFVRLGVNNMDRLGYGEFIQLYAKIINETVDGITAAGDNPEELQAVVTERMAAAQFQVITSMEKIMKKGIEIFVSNLRVQLPSGDVKGDLLVALKKDMTIAQFIPLIGQPDLVLDIFSLQSNMSFPAELAGESQMLLAPLYPGMQTGLFEKKAEYLVHKGETKDGKLFINGQEVLFH